MSVVIGYQGIGKSSLAMREAGWLDLESSCFSNDGKKMEDWHKAYGNIALDLSRQGNDVLVSSHAEVREWLGTQNPTGQRVFVCYPALSLRELWMKKLQIRYDDTLLQKDYRALVNAKDRYEANIREIIADADKYGFTKIELVDIFYDLKEELKKGMLHLWRDMNVYK